MEQPVRNPMGTAPVGTLMRAMGLPIILSMMIQALYNIVDSAFVSNMAGGEAALNALTLAFPVQMLMVAVGMAALLLFARPLCGLFGLSGATQALCVSAARVISLSFLFAGFNVALQGIFQAMDCGGYSLILSVCRQLLFVLPVAWGLARLVSPDLSNAWAVWLTFPIAEGLTAAIAAGLLARLYRGKIQPMG